MQTGKNLDYVDAMRGIAILMVILVHTSQNIKIESELISLFCRYGQMGVQLFFVASAFTLCNSAENRNNEPNKILNYFIRRFFRIAPVYYVGIILYFALGALKNYYKHGVLMPDEQYTLINILTNVLLVHGFFPPANNNIVPGGWSIGTEFAFYAIFPMLFVLLNGVIKSVTSAILALSCSVLISLAAIYSCQIVIGTKLDNNSFIYFNLATQLPVFILGVLFFKLNQIDAWPVKSKFSNILTFISISIFSVAIFEYGSDISFSLIPVISGFSFLFLFSFLSKDKIINCAPIRSIGKVSYSMYLFHFLIARGLTAFLVSRTEPFLHGSVTLFLAYIGSVATTFFIARISEKLIERPFIELGRKVIKGRAQIRSATEID